MLVNMKEILEKAKKEKYAVPHLNINNLEWTKYILEECEENKSPVILGVSEGAAKYMGGYITVTNMVKGLLKDLNITIPVCLHLDHGSTVEACKKALTAGFSSVMIDGSKHDLDTNIKMVNEVNSLVENQSIEAEVGCIGGTEDGVSNELAYAKVEDCVKLVAETKITCLAPALGSVHGFYKGEPKLDFERMEQIKESTNLPLVLHGGTGIPDNLIKQAISHGVCKINVNTELQSAWSTAVKEFLIKNPNVYDPRKVISAGEVAIKQHVKDKIILFGSQNKA